MGKLLLLLYFVFAFYCYYNPIDVTDSVLDKLFQAFCIPVLFVLGFALIGSVLFNWAVWILK